jgi:hypothetical protein
MQLSQENTKNATIITNMCTPRKKKKKEEKKKEAFSAAYSRRHYNGGILPLLLSF